MAVEPMRRFAALVCHPHPLGGGTMHNKVVYHAMKVFSGLGLPVLRFNFRGVGLSEGEFDHGVGELDDARAALDWLDAQAAAARFCWRDFRLGRMSECERVVAMRGWRG